MTVRELLAINDISLDDEIIIWAEVGEYDGKGFEHIQDFRTIDAYKIQNKVALSSAELDTYISGFLM